MIGIVTNTDGDAGGNELAWEAWASGDWYTMNAAWNTASDGDFDLALFPIVCPQNVTGIQDLSDYFALFPNPNNGQFAVVNSALFNGNLEIYNMMGQSVFSTALSGQPAINCDIASHKAGIYLIQITSDNGTWTSRVVKN